MGTTTLLVLRERLAQIAEGADYIEVDVTNDINNNNSIVSTTLNAYDSGVDDYFNDWWVYITTFANAGVFRKISDYSTAAVTLTVHGAALADDGSDTATIRLTKISPTLYLNALNESIREIYPTIHCPFDDFQLITGNILPPFNWSTTALLNQYTEPSGTLLKSTTPGLFRNGPTSAKVTASGANDDLVLDSDNYRRLLDLMNETVSLYCWVYPEAVNDAFIEIYTLQADGTAQTLTSTTTCPATAWTLLKLEDQKLNDDLVKLEVRLRTKTNTKYVYFDPPRLIGKNVYEYLVPLDYIGGNIRRVGVQTSTSADFSCDDLHPLEFEEVYGYDVFDDGTNEFIRLPYQYSNSRRIRIKGDYPTTVLSADTDTLPTNELKPLNLFLKYAEYKLFESLTAFPASQDVSHYELASAKAFREYYRLLPTSRMTRTPTLLNVRRY